MTDQKKRKITGSSVARIAGNILSGLVTNSAMKPKEGTVKDVLIFLADEAFDLAIYIAKKAEAYDDVE